jgi:putative solute:sodium symporter small subunit
MINNRNRRRHVRAIAARHPQFATMLRRTMMVMLPVWLAYFLAVSLSVKNLNAVTLPYVDMQLGTYLVIQGSVLAFAVTLYLLARAATRA